MSCAHVAAGHWVQMPSAKSQANFSENSFEGANSQSIGELTILRKSRKMAFMLPIFFGLGEEGGGQSTYKLKA